MANTSAAGLETAGAGQSVGGNFNSAASNINESIHNAVASSNQAIISNNDYRLELAQIIHQLSDGNAFWVEEFVSFVHESGVETFINTMQDYKEYHNYYLNNRKSSTILMRLPDTVSGGNSNGANTPKRGSIDQQHAPRDALQNNLYKQSFQNHSSSTMMTSAANTPSNRIIGVSNNSNISSTIPVVQQPAVLSNLELFVLCRFEKLSNDDQKILRIASVLGYNFSRHVLHAVLPRRLKAMMYKSLHRLILAKWLSPISNSNNSSGYYQHRAATTSSPSQIADSSVAEQAPSNTHNAVSSSSPATSINDHQFNHPLLHSTVYKLVPAADRRDLHRRAVNCLVEIYGISLKIYPELIKHFSQFNPAKTFEYIIRLLDEKVMSEETDVIINGKELLELLDMAIEFVHTSSDMSLVSYYFTIVSTDLRDRILQIFDNCQLDHSEGTNAHGQEHSIARPAETVARNSNTSGVDNNNTNNNSNNTNNNTGHWLSLTARFLINKILGNKKTAPIGVENAVSFNRNLSRRSMANTANHSVYSRVSNRNKVAYSKLYDEDELLEILNELEVTIQDKVEEINYRAEKGNNDLDAAASGDDDQLLSPARSATVNTSNTFNVYQNKYPNWARKLKALDLHYQEDDSHTLHSSNTLEVQGII